MLIKFTYGNGDDVYLAPEHITAVRESDEGVVIMSADGQVRRVREEIGEVLELLDGAHDGEYPHA